MVVVDVERVRVGCCGTQRVGDGEGEGTVGL